MSRVSPLRRFFQRRPDIYISPMAPVLIVKLSLGVYVLEIHICKAGEKAWG